MNQDKVQRNLDRELKHARHQTNPTAFPDDASDTSSMLTISETEDEPSTPEKSKLLSSLSKLTPQTRALAASILGQRDREVDEDTDDSHLPLPAAKRLCLDTAKEVTINPGDTVTLGFHTLLFDLARYNIYMPLNLFTNSNIRLVNREAHSLTLRRINSPGKRASKPPLVLDVEAFEKKYGREVDLTRDQWSEAARNFTRFAGEVGRDGEQGDYFMRWDNHYGFFEERTDAAEHFQAILEVDINMRKDYIVKPFAFSRSLYNNTYEAAKLSIRVATIERLHRLHPDTSSVRPPRALDSRSAPSIAHGAPFRKGSSSDPSSAVCLRCARRGHTLTTCLATSFEDGQKITTTTQNGSLARGPSILCHVWNVRGDRSCSHSPSRVHSCSFCGDKRHHALAWVCRKEPPRSSS
ncbi:hypothetical protein AB1N83_014447 [Pleurotus pulmonarius]